jgi:toxin ParE1/3/4
MKVIYADEALDSLDGILAFIATNYPTKSAAFEKRLRAVVMRIGAWPESAAEVAERPGVRVVPLIRYPYKVFYRVTSDAVEILYIHHAARRVPWEGDLAKI